MKKQELIHLHGLLSEVRNQFDVRTESALDVPEYDTQNTRPTSIHHSKNDHRSAVLALANGLAANMAEGDVEAVAPRAD
ncbi:UPF0058 family protein [Haladaptatus sp. NG-WS-4]